LRARKNKTAQIIWITFILFWILNSVHTVQAASFFEQFIDPHDNKFDASNWLLNKKGFLPVPIIITEPAVGYGAGVALLFFHPKKDEPYQEQVEQNSQEASEKKKP